MSLLDANPDAKGPAPNDPNARLRLLTRLMWILPGLALAFVAWVFISRWMEGRRMEERAAQEKQSRESEENRRAFENLGGNRFEILHFYASPAIIRRGQSASLCYGVSNAKSVRIEPQSAGVWPSASRCFDVSPRRDTTYTLTIGNAAGQTKTASFLLRVQY
jgi:hypothetical protein